MSAYSELAEMAAKLAPEARQIFKNLVTEGRFGEARTMASKAISETEAPISKIAKIADDAEAPHITPSTEEMIRPQQTFEIHPEAEALPKVEVPEPEVIRLKQQELPTGQGEGHSPIPQEVIPEGKAAEPISAYQEGHLEDTVKPVQAEQRSINAEETTPTRTPELKTELEQVPPSLRSNETVDMIKRLPEKSPLLSDRTKKILKYGVPAAGAAAVTGMLMGDDEQPSGTTPTNAIAQEPGQEKSELDLTKNPLEVKGKIPIRAPAGVKAPSKPAAPSTLDALTKMLNFEATGQESGMADALAKQNEALRDAKMNRYLNLIGAGAARLSADPVNADYERALKESGLPVEQYKQLLADQENDPRSGISAGMRDYLKTLGVNVSPNATAGQMKQVVPYIFKDVEAKQAQQARREDQKERLDARLEENKYKWANLKEQREQRLQEKEKTRSEKLHKEDRARLDKLNNKLTAALAVRSPFGKAALNVQSVDNVQALLDGVDPNDLDPRQVFETARVLDRILSQGQPTQYTSQHLSPETAYQDTQKMLEYITNQRRGAGAGDFMKSVAHTLEREKERAQKQIQETQGELLAGNKDLYEKYPEEFGDMLSARGLSPDIFKPGKAAMYRQSGGDNQHKTDPRDAKAIKILMDQNAGMSKEDAEKALAKYKKESGI